MVLKQVLCPFKRCCYCIMYIQKVFKLHMIDKIDQMRLFFYLFIFVLFCFSFNQSIKDCLWKVGYLPRRLLQNTEMKERFLIELVRNMKYDEVS